MMALDFATQLQEMKAIAGQPDFALGSVHAVTRDGALVIASASGSQLASYAWGAANVIFVVGAQKLVPTLEAARERIYQHSLKLEDARAYAAYGQNSSVGKILEIHQELPGPHPRRPHPTGGRVLIAGGSILMATPEPGVGGTASADPSDAFYYALDRRHARRVPNVPLFVRPDIDRVALADQA